MFRNNMAPANSHIEKVSSTRALFVLVLFYVIAGGMSAGAMGFPKGGAIEINSFAPAADVDLDADDDQKWLENRLSIRQMPVGAIHFTGSSQVLSSRPDAGLEFARAPPALFSLHR